eukprot:COSAG01_NODE_3722_length_5764_cov_2.506796_2_plen_442_part_00
MEAAEALAAEARRTGAEEETVMSVLAMARAQLPEVGGLTGLFTLLAWAKPGAAVEQEGEGAVAVAQIMSSQELMLLMESVTEGDKIAGLAGEEAAAPYIEAAAHMMINVITSATAGLGHREAVVDEGGVELALSWLDKYTENAQICRAASTLLAVLLQSPKGAERLNEEEFAGLAMLIDVLDRSVPQDAAAEQDEEGDANTTVYFNALLAPTLDIVEKLMLCLFRALKTSTKARNRAMELGVVTKVFRILGAAKSSVLYARGICGVLNVLLEGPQIPGEGEEESALAVLEEVEEENVEARLVAMMESDLLQVLIKSLRYNVGDFAIAGVSALMMRASPTAAVVWWPVVCWLTWRTRRHPALRGAPGGGRRGAASLRRDVRRRAVALGCDSAATVARQQLRMAPPSEMAVLLLLSTHCCCCCCCCVQARRRRGRCSRSRSRC